ncbi:DUF2975 domain-containing protein [Qipengyuania sp. DSG2-2]|uniref:DUF2975 domain-containing protein n=1 Tax=Qipengyuania sp. DGS2-2 TaxID=3349631 RepID=UPI0036D32658
MLRTAHIALGFLNALNWALGVMFVLLFAFLAIEPDALPAKIETEFDPQQTGALVTWLWVSCAVTLATVPLAHVIFTRLRRMIRELQTGDVFSPSSIATLRTIALCMLGISVGDLVFGLTSVKVSEQTGEYLGWSPSVSIWLVSGLLFILARIFEEGRAMREELEGTV